MSSLILNIVTLTIHVFAFTLCGGSLFNPHLFPQTGPFFEGWYLRITDFENKDSLGFLFGSVLPEKAANGSAPPIIVSILRRKCSQTSGLCKLTSIDEAFELEKLNITVNGSNSVTTDPDRLSPPYFRWEVSNEKSGCYFEQNGNTTNWNLKIDDLLFRGQADSPFLWDLGGQGPEGALGYFPLPLHWFVYSSRSHLVHYDIQNVTSGETFQSSNGVVHMEKNWGKSFPRGWIWSEGVDPASNASFALSGGLVDFTLITIPGYLIGYRNPSTGVNLSFKPVTSTTDAKIDGCKGTVNITVTTPSHRVTIDIYGRTETFSSCLYGPEAKGFRPDCVESYDSTAVFSVYSHKSFLLAQYELTETKTFTNIALEFGGLNVCNNSCASV